MFKTRRQPIRKRAGAPATRAGAAMLIAAIAMIAAGCQTKTVEQSLTATVGGSDPEMQMEFWHQLYDKDLTSNDDALHGMLLFLDGKDDAADYAARVQTLKDRGLLPASFDRPADEAITRGTVAIMLYHALDLKGGVMATLLPNSPRYTMRELQFVGIYPQSSPQQTFSGGQFVSLIGRLEDYQRQAQPTAHQPRRPIEENDQPADEGPRPDAPQPDGN